jgi:hypothetical protein
MKTTDLENLTGTALRAALPDLSELPVRVPRDVAAGLLTNTSLRPARGAWSVGPSFGVA